MLRDIYFFGWNSWLPKVFAGSGSLCKWLGQGVQITKSLEVWTLWPWVMERNRRVVSLFLIQRVIRFVAFSGGFFFFFLSFQLTSLPLLSSLSSCSLPLWFSMLMSFLALSLYDLACSWVSFFLFFFNLEDMFLFWPVSDPLFLNFGLPPFSK